MTPRLETFSLSVKKWDSPDQPYLAASLPRVHPFIPSTLSLATLGITRAFTLLPSSSNSLFLIITGNHFTLHLLTLLAHLLPLLLTSAAASAAATATHPLTAAAALLCLIPEKAICTPATILTPISSPAEEGDEAKVMLA